MFINFFGCLQIGIKWRKIQFFIILKNIYSQVVATDVDDETEVLSEIVESHSMPEL